MLLSVIVLYGEFNMGEPKTANRMNAMDLS